MPKDSVTTDVLIEMMKLAFQAAEAGLEDAKIKLIRQLRKQDEEDEEDEEDEGGQSN